MGKRLFLSAPEGGLSLGHTHHNGANELDVSEVPGWQLVYFAPDGFRRHQVNGAIEVLLRSYRHGTLVFSLLPLHHLDAGRSSTRFGMIASLASREVQGR